FFPEPGCRFTPPTVTEEGIIWGEGVRPVSRDYTPLYDEARRDKGVTEIALMPVDTLGEFYQRVEAVEKTLPEGSLILTDFVGGT
ncbi:hypothetical protein MJN69_28770, partial [Salmonella enterica subsp. enterica serovar Kentucky]|nr:hypothetical protein [Salmonella enterica subsp. enterica serovar Kentucky]